MQPDHSIAQLALEWRPPSVLRKDPRNSKLHTPKQIKQVARSIEEFGWTNPILIDEADGILAGHARLAAARQLGMAEVPTIRLAHMSAVQKRAYIIADNKLAENAKWDPRMLALEHEAIQLLDPEFDLCLMGFELDEIEVMLDNELRFEQDEVREPDLSQPPVSRIGDLWALGDHRLYCGDALQRESYERLLGGEKAQMVLTDAPYNVRIDGNVASKGRHREFVMASGEMSPVEFTEFLTRACANLIAFSEEGSIHYLFMDWRHMRELLAAGEQYAELKNLVCWDKGSAGMGSFYRSRHELIFVFKNGAKRHINNFGLGEKGRHRSNVWTYPGLNGWTPSRDAELAMHPTVKPLAMIMDAMKDCSTKGGLVLDCFGGSGTTIIAAEQTGRRARVIELDPHYADVIIRRYQAATAQKAILVDDGRPFELIERKGR